MEEGNGLWESFNKSLKVPWIFYRILDFKGVASEGWKESEKKKKPSF